MIDLQNEHLNSLTSSIFRENEIRVNRLIGIVSFFLALLYILSGFLNYIGVFEVNYHNLHKTYFGIGLLMLTGIAISRIVSKKFFYLEKIILLTTLVVANSITAFYFFIFSRLLFALPIFLSIGYYKRKVIIYTSTTLWIGLIYTAKIPQNTYLSQYTPTAILEEVIIPQTWVVFLLAIIAISFAVSGKKQIIRQAQKTLQLSSVKSEISLAAKIQESVLPSTHYVHPDNSIEIEASISPAKDVAGDFYDYYPLDNDNIAIIIADVSDKGVPAAMFMMQARETIKNLLYHKKNLQEAIRKANIYLAKNNKGGMFVTAWIGILNTKTGIGKFINAGHLPPFIKHSDGSIENLENDPDVFMGTFENAEYTSHLFELKKGDSLILYTDGATDAMDDYGLPFGAVNLKNIIATAASPKDICQNISSTVTNYSKKDLFDDITIFSLYSNIDYKPQVLDIEASTSEKKTSEIIDNINKLLANAACPEDTRKSVDTILDEICENIIDYAYGDDYGMMHINCEIGANNIKIVFEDYGTEFNPLNEKTPEKAALFSIGGYGIHFVKNLADEVSYERIDGKNKLTVKLVWIA